ncbi:MAG: hypothetical protein KDI75_11320 [Xanthomonadales bacterium]|nr:hypothetical protein [Xanthomonadales bacterium]
MLRQVADVMAGPYTISFDHRHGELRVQVKGESSMANTLAYWNEIAEWVARYRPQSLLLVDELTGTPLTADEWMALVQAMDGKGFDALRIAHVKPNGLERVEFCEIFATEAGLDARVFTDVRVAELWLRHGERRHLRQRGDDVADAQSARRRSDEKV